MVRYFRQNGLRNTLFVDGFLFIIRKWLLAQQAQFAIDTIEDLSWDINYDKSQLEGKTKCVFIGFNVILHRQKWSLVTSLTKKM